MNISIVNCSDTQKNITLRKENQNKSQILYRDLSYLPKSLYNSECFNNKNNISFGCLSIFSAQNKKVTKGDIFGVERKAQSKNINLNLFFEYPYTENSGAKDSKKRVDALNSLLDNKISDLDSVKDEFQGIASVLYTKYNKGESVKSLDRFVKFITSDELKNVYNDEKIQENMGKIIIRAIKESPEELMSFIKHIGENPALLNDEKIGRFLANSDSVTSGDNAQAPIIIFKNSIAKSDGDELRGFKRIGGQEEAIEKLKDEILFPMQYPELYEGVRCEKDVILYGPPGTGKSLLAQALSEEFNGYFKKIGASEMSDHLVGSSEKNWRNLFKELEKNQPSILFIDEIDALGKKRGGQDVHGDKELNQFLQLVSDANARNLNIVVIGATNNFEALDSALLRDGRFGVHIEMPAPKNIEEIEKIFNIHTRKIKMDKSVEEKKSEIFQKMLDLKLTGSSIAAIVKDAHKNALKRTGIRDKMENGSISKSDKDNFQLTAEDFTFALNEREKKLNPDIKIGFTGT